MYDTILFPTDGSEGATTAAEHAIDIARAYDATIHVLYVVDVRMSPLSSVMEHDDVIDMLETSGENPTVPIRQRAEDVGVRAIEAVRLGVPDEIIREYADEHAADLIVMGTHGRTGLEHTLLGSVTERVVRTSERPVLTVRREG
ncbi:universal stress protein [Haladaptatus sp. NG-WS-4]